MVLFGAPTFRLEFHLTQVSEVLGLKSSFFILPGMILISFGSDESAYDSVASSHIVQTPSGQNMGKLSEVNKLCHDIEDKKMPIDQAILSLEMIRSRGKEGILAHPLLASRFSHFIAFPIHSFTICIIAMNGKLFEALMAAIISIPIAGLVIAAES